MRTTRKRVIKTVYKDEDDSEQSGDFSDSGSEAKISDEPSSDEEDIEEDETSSEDFQDSKKSLNKTKKQTMIVKKTKFAKNFINKLNKSSDPNESVAPTLFSVKDLTDADKLLPSILNLSESDSSDNELSKVPSKNISATSGYNCDSESDLENKTEYQDVWSTNQQENSAEIARKAFMELEQHKSKIEETKVSIQNYTVNTDNKGESNVKDLLAQGEEVLPQQSSTKKKHKGRKNKHDSDSDLEDWEEVKDVKGIPQQGLQLVVDFPDAVSRKTKKIDVEMMMRRKINRVKKEYQVYMHKVHVLCWLGHGNFISRVLNDQEVMVAALSLVPSKDCYPGERVDMKYVEQITKWYKDKFTIKEDKNEDKFRPKAPPLKNIMLGHIKSRVVTARKYLVYIFVSMLRALGLQCRVMFNFVTVPIKPPTSELCSLSTKSKNTNVTTESKEKSTEKVESKKKLTKKDPNKSKSKISQMDGNYDRCWSSDTDFDNLMQVDGANDAITKTRSKRSARMVNKNEKKETSENEDVSPPKRSKKSPSPKPSKSASSCKSKKPKRTRSNLNSDSVSLVNNVSDQNVLNIISPRKTRNSMKDKKHNDSQKSINSKTKPIKKTDKVPDIITKEDHTSSKYFEKEKLSNNTKRLSLSRNKSDTVTPSNLEEADVTVNKDKTASSQSVQKSKYFVNSTEKRSDSRKLAKKLSKKEEMEEDKQRVSHKDLIKSKRGKIKNEVKSDLIDIIKNRVKEVESKKAKVKGKAMSEFDEDSDYLPEEAAKHQNSDSEDDFKPKLISPKASTSRKIDRRVLSSDDETPKNRTNLWCEVFVEELEQWVAVDIVKSQVHCVNEIYGRMTHPACYIIGWDNNNYVKDLTRRYVPHWNTVTRKQRVESEWWNKALQPWLGPKTARDREEDECLDRMQLEAPLPKSIAEYKNHPLYALKRHLLKFEAIYPPDAATLGFVRGEPVYARDCVYTCRSRDIWLKEAKVVRLGEQPYKIVKSRPKWDRLSNKLITDKPLEIFGPWQVQDYEPPVAENGKVPRNAYGNVELFKECMLPKGTVHIKLPGLNRVAKKLNIDCAPAMIGFDFNGGWSHPVYDGFVVCEEFEETITEAWLKDQEELERREREKIDSRVYGNWKRLIKGLLIRERLKDKYGFENPKEEDNKKKAKGPRVVVKKR